MRKSDDPFAEYMKSSEDDEKMSESSENEEPVDLLPCLQVTIALMNLLTDLESKEGEGLIKHTT